MPYNGSGTFSIINTFLPNTTILSAAVNQNLTDIASGLSDVLTRDGQAGMTANLAMGNNKITGMADPSLSSDGATKNYVDTQFNTAWSTGDVKLTLKTVADSGWLLFDDTTMGSATSGANHASAANQALFTLLYNSPFTDSSCPILTSAGAATTRGAQGTAAQAWAANCRMTLPLTLGRALAVAGSGSGLTARVLGTTTGTETAALTASLTPNVTVNLSGGSVALGSNSIALANGNPTTISGANFTSGGGNTAAITSTGTWVGVTGTGLGLTGTLTSSNTGGTSPTHNNMQPSSFLNAMVKL